MKVESDKFYKLISKVENAMGDIHRADKPKKTVEVSFNKEEIKFLYYLMEALPDIVADSKTHTYTLKTAGIL